MKKTLTTLAMMTATLLSSCTPKSDNPLLSVWDTPYAVPPFDQIKLEHYKPAIDTLMAAGRDSIAAIASNPEAPTFENTVERLEYSGRPLDRVLNVMFNMNSAETTPELQDLIMDISPALTEYSNDIALNEQLFARVKAVYDAREERDYTPEEAALLRNTYKGFVRNGALLDSAGKERYREVTSELSQLSLQFQKNVLDATNAFRLPVTDEADLDGLPESVREAAAADAKAIAAGDSSFTAPWVFTLQAPSYIPFMTYSSVRPLREKMYRAYNSRAFSKPGAEGDNQDIVLKIVNLRLEEARLLGYGTFADYVLEERMAATTGRVNALLDELLEKSKSYAEADVTMISKYAASQGLAGPLMPWDWSYYTEKYKDEHYQLNDEMTRPYFKLESVQEAMFMLAERLYGLTFVENSSIPVYQKDVHAFEVYDTRRDGSLLAILYIDYFPREGKRGGAWMNDFRPEYIDPTTGGRVVPIITLVTNFTKPTETRPSLLSYDEVETIFHEFGHALHGMLGQGKYPSITGTAVYRDFVELPSQLMENWVAEKAFLDLWAKHYETGEKMPAELIGKIVSSRQYLAAYQNVRQIYLGITDMAWHTLTQPVTASVPEFERNASLRAQILPIPEGTSLSTSFSHIFSGGYAAGYYSYKWSEVLDADVFEKFKTNGLFDKATAESLRENILEKGGSEHPMVLFVRFAGSEPTVEPLLKRMGLMPSADAVAR